MNALELAERALALAGEEEADVVVHLEHSGFARFARSEVHQPTLVDGALVELRVLRGERAGLASGTATDDAALRLLAERARGLALAASPDPLLPRPAGPAELPRLEALDPATAALPPEELARLAGTAIAAASPARAYGYATAGGVELAVASSRGLRAHERQSDAALLVLAAEDGASGFAQRAAIAVSSLDVEGTAREATGLAARTRGAGTLPPGSYPAVLGPYAVAELLHWFAYDSLSGLGLLEERSYFAGRIGERVFDPKLTLVEDPLDPRGLPKGFDFEGTPRRRVPLVEAGVARGVVWDRSTAARAGVESTGHALPAAQRAWGPQPIALHVEPGAASDEELDALVGDGIRVTRLHYLSIVDPRAGVITGMTRDGTFRIRGGRVAEPLVNLRFTVSVPELLAELPGIGRERMLVPLSELYDERYAFGALVPALATARFAVTGVGSGPGL